MPKLRDHLYEEKTTSGATRIRFRWDRDAKRITMKSVPGEAEFEREYRRLVDLHRRGGHQKPIRDEYDGTYRGLVHRYFKEMDTLVDQRLMAEATRKQRVNLLGRTLPKFGPGKVLTLRPEHVRKIMGQFRDTPSQANNVLKTLRAMLEFAVDEGLLPDNPTTGVKRFKVKTDGFTAWNRDQLHQFVAAHPVGTKAHLAMMLLIGTACRRSDLVLLGPDHVEEVDGHRRLSFLQAKHGFAEESRVTVPVIRPLKEALAAAKQIGETFLLNEYGRPFSKNGFGDRFRKWCDQAELPKELSTHGVRKAVGALLADAGCSGHEIMAFHGHADARTSEIYTRTANRAVLATNAAARASLDELLGGDNDED